jgi:hypothetical protein
MNLKSVLEGLFGKAGAGRPRIPEDEIPVDASGRPDLSRYTRPLEHYCRYYEEYQALTARRTRVPDEVVRAAYAKKVHATWAFIARGAESLPYVLKLLRSPDPEARADAAGILADLGDREGVADALLRVAEEESDPEALTVALDALARLREPRALPLIARIVRDPARDEGDVRWCAVESLERYARRKFTKQPDPVAAACAWLEARGY